MAPGNASTACGQPTFIECEIEVITPGVDGVYIDIHVQPGARRTRVVGRHGDALKMAIAAPPVGRRANDALVRALAEVLGIPPGNVSLVKGTASRRKRLFARGIEVQDALRKIDAKLT